MAYIIVDQWDAVEIFCRVLVKFDKKLSLKQFHLKEFLKDMLDQYSRKEAHTKVTMEIFGGKYDHNDNPFPKRPNAFYELCRKISHANPAVIPEDEYRGFMKYINLSLEHFPYRKTKEWEPHKRQNEFENSKWTLYYLHRDAKDIENPVDQPLVNGIATAHLELRYFGKAKITGFKPSECYEGKFEIYEPDDKLIKLNMQLKKNRKKDLSMLIYVGTAVPTLCIGQYHNLGRSIYSGTVMLEPVTKNSEKEKNPGFYVNDDIKKLPKHVQQYFSDKSINMLRVPCKVTSLQDFDEWQRVYNANKKVLKGKSD